MYGLIQKVSFLKFVFMSKQELDFSWIEESGLGSISVCVRLFKKK